MGFFDKIFGKGKKDENKPEINDVKESENIAEEEVAELKEESVSNENVNEKVSEADTEEKTAKSADEPKQPEAKAENAKETLTDLPEMFPVKADSVSPARSAEICNRFINNTLNMGEELKVSDIVTLNYFELCVLYNTLQMMELNMDPKLKAIASVVLNNNKKVIRARLLTMLKKQTLYVLYTAINKLPFVRDGAFYLFTDKAIAEDQIKKSDISGLGIKEITEEQLEAHFDMFYVTGYNSVIVDVRTKVAFSDLFTPKDAAVYGVINPSACIKMIFFNQLVSSFTEKAKKENRNVTAEENATINKIWIDITETLIHCDALVLPAEKTEDGKIDVKAMALKGPDGKNWLAMFTDAGAVTGFLKANSGAAAIKNAILSQYAVIKDKPDLEGIIINPGRESFRIPSKLLAARKVEKTDEAASDTEQNK